MSVHLLFFPFWFSSCCFSVDYCVLCVVSCRCNQFFLALFFFFSFSCCLWVVLSTLSSNLACPLSPSFIDTYSLSKSSVGCKVLWIVMNFLVLWSIWWSSSYYFTPLRVFHTRTLFSILVYVNNVVKWMVSICLFISNPFTNPLACVIVV